MNEEKHGSPISAGLRLIKDNGLIVIALLALAWQLYFVSTTNAEQDAKWRMELAEYRQMISGFHAGRTQHRGRVIEVLTRFQDTLQAMEKTMSQAVSDCLEKSGSSWPRRYP